MSKLRLGAPKGFCRSIAWSDAFKRFATLTVGRDRLGMEIGTDIRLAKEVRGSVGPRKGVRVSLLEKAASDSHELHHDNVT